MNKYLASIATASSIALAGMLIVPREAEAVTITLDGTDYEISTLEGSFDDNQALLD